MNAVDRPAVLCVDDEPAVLQGLTHHLRRGFRVSTATSGSEGLERIRGADFAVVISDMRMPGMDGAAFLEAVRSASPHTVRMLLTGYSDVDAAARAVNQGQIFRFLTKPCPPVELKDAVDAAVQQHRLIQAERVLLEQTLRGSVNVLIDVLAITAPLVFGRAKRLERHVGALAERIGLEERWQVEVAAMLSQIGYVTLPDQTAEKMYEGKSLTDSEREMIGRAPELVERLLRHIPHLESVLEIVTKSSLPFRGASGAVPPLGARMLRLASDYDELEARGAKPAEIIASLRGRSSIYDPALVDAFAEVLGHRDAVDRVRSVQPWALRPGMVLAEDVRLKTGVLFLSRGHEVTESLIARMLNLPKGALDGPLAVIVPKGFEESDR